MYVRRISLVNWMAFAGAHVVDDLPPGPIAVVGRYTENARRSNWSGKTALLEAVRFALTGVHRKRTDDSLITHDQALLVVEVELSTGLVVTRTRPRGGPTVLSVVDPVNAPGLKMERDAAAEHLARVLRLPVADFDNTTWFGQGDVQALCGQTSGMRREVFARWLDLDMWERMGKRAMQQAREARVGLEVARQANNGTPPRPVGEIEAERAGLESRRVQAEADREQIAASLERAAATAGQLANIAARRADAEAATRALQTVREQLVALPVALPPEQFAALDEQRITERAALDAAEREITEVGHLLGGRFDGQCPVTCEACPVADEVSGKRAAFVERGRVARLERDRAKTSLGELTGKVGEARTNDERRIRLVAQMNEATKRARSARQAFEEASAGVDVDVVRRAETERDDARAALARADADLREIGLGLGRLAEEERQGALYATRQAARVRQVEVAERAAKVAQLVARGLGGSGIPARIAQVSLSGLEERANALLAGLGLSFTLTWERELADPAPACAECGHVYEKRTRARECPSCGAPRARKKSDELDVLVDDGSGEVEDVRAKSGGAKVLVASAIRLAGGMMLRERRGSPLEVAFVDEPFGELDLENRDALARTFAGLLSSVGLEQAFVVSHDAQLLAGLPARIVVTREGSSSRLDLEA